MIKTFKGRIGHDAQITIRLSTNNGMIGYKILKFQIMALSPGADSVEHVSQIYSIDPDGATTDVNFDNPTLLATSFLTQSSSAGYANYNVIFDNKVINQDVFVTQKDNGPGSKGCNYYVELEQVKLDLGEATVATLKDMRGTN